jgi:hypothetical protein
MKSIDFLILATCGFISLAVADDDEPPVVIISPGGEPNSWDAEWKSVMARSYLMRFSDNLETWQYVPETELGDGIALAWSFASTTEKGFFRLKYDADAFTTDSDTQDLDGDGIGNLMELRHLHTDPMNSNGWTDADGDGIHDLIELHWFPDLTVMNATSDADQNGIPDILQIQDGTAPVTDLSASPGVRSEYDYNAMGRLTIAEEASQVQQFVSDAEGNLESNTNSTP